MAAVPRLAPMICMRDTTAMLPAMCTVHMGLRMRLEDDDPFLAVCLERACSDTCGRRAAQRKQDRQTTTDKDSYNEHGRDKGNETDGAS